MYQFIESIKIENGQAFLLNLHQQRIYQTFTNFNHKCIINLHALLSSLQPPQKGLYKWRIIYNLNGNFEHQFVPYSFTEIKDFELVENNEINYSFKYLDRTHLDTMKKQSLTQEIIIVKKGFISDTTFSNLIFLKDGIWHTPKTFLLNGVQRLSLIHLGIIQKTEINLENLKKFSHFQIINAMNDFNSSFIYPINKIINI